MSFTDFREEDEWEYRVQRFRDPGGKSALHPGKREYPCPTCGRANQLTSRDVKKGYQCDRCADMQEGAW